MKNETADLISKKLYNLAVELFPIYRSITGEGVRATLNILQREIPDLVIGSVKSGTKVFDWIVPPEWNLKKGYIKDLDGKTIVDFKSNNLHIVSYSQPINKIISIEELQGHLYSLEDQPKAIPYVTSYYQTNWGFCITQEQRNLLVDDFYYVLIESEFNENGELNYGELILYGELKDEILLSTYICHPSMANNEVSGPVVTVELVKWLKNLRIRRYTYRILFLPETIGAISYLSLNNHLEYLKLNVKGGFQITCVGDNNAVSYLKSKYGNSYLDQVVSRYLLENDIQFKMYDFTSRGSDERQWSSPGLDLPIVSLMRSKYHEYPEYHTSLDNLEFISPEGLLGGFDNIRNCLWILENDYIYVNNILCEPFLSNRGVDFKLGNRNDRYKFRADLMNVLTYCDGTNSCLKIAEITDLNTNYVFELINILIEQKLIKKYE